MRRLIQLFIDRYNLSILIISAFVASLIHFPELISLFDIFERHRLFPGMRAMDVVSEVWFTFVSLIILFALNTSLFGFKDPKNQMAWWKILLSFLLIWVVSSLLGHGFVVLHHYYNIPAIDAMVHHYLHPLRDFILACVVTGSCYIIYLIRRQQFIVIENERLQSENILNKYEALKNQLNPHMLFNSLNTLRSLVRESPEKAQDYIQELSRVLRYTLEDKQDKDVMLSEEMFFTEAYTFLLKMRYEDNLQFEESIDKKFHAFRLPPMTLQLLIENAVKHNEISNKRPLVISIKTEPDGTLSVCNPIQVKLTKSQGPGIGLVNLSERFRLLYKRAIAINSNSGIFCVKIPLIPPVQ